MQQHPDASDGESHGQEVSARAEGVQWRDADAHPGDAHASTSKRGGMGRRIVPLPQDDLQQDYGGVAPTRRSLKRTMHIIEAEARLEQKGWRAACALLRLYSSILLPVVVVSVWMFALYAALSYAVPTVLCSSAVRSSAGITQGFVNCIYNHGGDYSHDTGIKVFWLLFWAAQQFWISGFSGLMGYAMFPGCFRAIDILIIVTLAVGSALVTLIGAPLGHYDLNSNLLVLLPTVVTAGVTITTGFASARYTGSKVDAARYLCMFGLGGVVVAIYTFLMPTLVTSRTSINQLLILRLVVHPTIWSLLIVVFSNTVRHIGAVPNLMQAVLWIWPVMYKSIYGRFLLLQLGNTSNIVILNVLISVYNVAGRLATRQGSGMLLQLMYGARTAEALAATNAMNQIRLAELFASTIAEHAGIVAASAIYSFGRVSALGKPPNHYNIWMSALCQSLTTLLADFVALACDWKYHNIDYFMHWVTNMRIFLTYILIIITLGSSRLCVELLMLFCPVYTEDEGILLRYCDKPSLFGRIGKH